MSHYLVGVITKNKPEYEELCDILSPFDESIEVEPYVAHTYEQVKETFEDILKKHDHQTPNKNRARFRALKKALATDDIEGIQSFNAWYHYYEDIDSAGNALSTYNPQSKWDWWHVGGRWGDTFEDDSVQLKELKRFPVEDYSLKELKKKFPEYYRDYKKLLKDGHIFKPEYYLERYPTFEKYVSAKMDFVPFAFVDVEGEWHEPGQMGWFGVDTSTEESIEKYDEEYWNVVESHPDYYMTIIDCHI